MFKYKNLNGKIIKFNQKIIARSKNFDFKI